MIKHPLNEKVKQGLRNPKNISIFELFKALILSPKNYKNVNKAIVIENRNYFMINFIYFYIKLHFRFIEEFRLSSQLVQIKTISKSILYFVTSKILKI